MSVPPGWLNSRNMEQNSSTKKDNHCNEIVAEIFIVRTWKKRSAISLEPRSEYAIDAFIRRWSDKKMASKIAGFNTLGLLPTGMNQRHY